MLGSKTLALCLLASTSSAALAGKHQQQPTKMFQGDPHCFTDPLPTYAYYFEPEYAAGVSGSIEVHYAGPYSTFAKIKANLDFSDVDYHELGDFDGNCTEEVTEYKWHIHTKWSSGYGSESFGQCGLDLTGNHYDPLKACGPNSEFVGTDDCKDKTPEYACNSKAYRKDPLVCEKGDLSGKFGGLKLDKYKKVKDKWHDANFPLPEETTPEWNLILHAVCGDVTPRIACAVVELPPVWCE